MLLSPTWLGYLAALAMLTLAVYCAGRLCLARRLGRSNNYDDNGAHVLMGVAMAGMFVPGWNVVPTRAGEIVFGAVALYFVARRVRLGGTAGGACRSHTLMHAVMGGSMVYMYWLLSRTAEAGQGMMAGPPSGAGDPSVTLLLAAVLFASAVFEVDGVVRLAGLSLSLPEGGSVGRPFLAPRLESTCHVAMCLAMGLMLVLMV
jgi:hypothetical protein